MSEKKFWTAKTDRVFETILCDENNSDLLKEFIERILNKKIKSLELLNPELKVNNTLEKVKTLDLLVNTSDEYINIELNTSMSKPTYSRNFNYITSVYNDKNIREEQYDYNTMFIHIDLTYEMSKELPLTDEFEVTSKKSKRNYISNFKIIEYNMDKIMDLWYTNDKEKEKYKHLIMLDLTDFEEIGKGDTFIQKFGKEVISLNNQETFQRRMSYEEEQRIIMNSEKAEARKEGMEIGEKNGKIEGINTRNFEIAKNMLEANFNVADIVKITGLTKKEVVNLQAN